MVEDQDFSAGHQKFEMPLKHLREYDYKTIYSKYMSVGFRRWTRA